MKRLAEKVAAFNSPQKGTKSASEPFARTYSHVTKLALPFTHFPYWFFFFIHKKYYLYKNTAFSNKDYLLFIYTFMGMIIFWRRIHLRLQSHQICTSSADLEMARNRDRLSLSWTKKFYLIILIWDCVSREWTSAWDVLALHPFLHHVPSPHNLPGTILRHFQVNVIKLCCV